MRKRMLFCLCVCLLTGCTQRQVALEPLESTATMSAQDIVMVDDSNQYSRLQLEQLQTEVTESVKAFNQIFYSFDYQTTKKKDYQEEIEAFFDKESDKYKTSVSTAYKDFKKDKTISSYEDTKVLSFVILDREETKAQMVALANTELENNQLEKGRYSVLTTYILKKEENGWKLLSRIPSKIYKTESVSLEGEGEKISVTGTVVGEYALPRDEKDERKNRTSYGDGYMEEQLTGKKEEASEATTEFEPVEKTYDTLEDAITDELIDKGTKEHD